MIRVACLMMQKNEVDLLDPWIRYHGRLFGFDNLFVWDNGSTDAAIHGTLDRYAGIGLNVDRAHNDMLDFRRKGVILGNKILELEQGGDYDFFIPIDCDEFLCVETDTGKVQVDQRSIFAELETLTSEDAVLGIDFAYYNVYGHNDHYWRWKHVKSFFRSGTFKVMDHGFHEGRSRLSSDRRSTRIGYVHLHHKPHDVLVEHSRAKLRPYMDIDDPDVLKAEVEKNNRLAIFINSDASDYMKKFTRDKAYHLPEVGSRFREINSVLPFRTVG